PIGAHPIRSSYCWDRPPRPRRPQPRKIMPPSRDEQPRPRIDERAKDEQLEAHRTNPEETYLTTNQGLRVSHTDDSLKAGSRGPTLMEDFHFREKMTHFDHESIPERVVHARGSGAYGYFQTH